MAKEKNSFILYYDSQNYISMLSDEQAGKLIKNLFSYSISGEVTEMDGMTLIAFTAIKTYLDLNTARYAEICKRRKENIEKRWNNTSEYKCIQSDTNVFPDIQVNTNVTDTDNDNESDTDTDTEYEYISNLSVSVDRGVGEEPTPARQTDLSDLKRTYEFLIKRDLANGDRDAANAHYKAAKDLGIEIDAEAMKEG